MFCVKEHRGVFFSNVVVRANLVSGVLTGTGHPHIDGLAVILERKCRHHRLVAHIVLPPPLFILGWLVVSCCIRLHVLVCLYSVDILGMESSVRCFFFLCVCFFFRFLTKSKILLLVGRCVAPSPPCGLFSLLLALALYVASPWLFPAALPCSSWLVTCHVTLCKHAWPH